MVVIAVLASLTAGLAMAAAAGARRTATALVRLETVTHAQDAMVFTSQVGDLRPNWHALEKRPEVARLAVWDLMFGNIAGQPGGLLFVSHDGTWLGSVDRPVVIQGRMFNPRADEMVVDEETAATNHVGVGDVVPFQAFSPTQSDLTGVPAGPSFRIRVVGIVRNVDEFLFASAGVVSPWIVTHHGNQILLHPNAVVRLTHGEADVAALRRDVNTLVAPGVPVLDLDNAARRVTTTLAVERFALALLAAAIAAAGALIVIQVLLRSTSVMTEDAPALRAMGMSRRDIATGAVLAHVPVAALAGCLSVLFVVALSPAFPIGEGRRIDPDVGLHADWLVIAVGTALLVFVVLAIAGTSGYRADSVASRRNERGSGTAAWLRRRTPLPVGLGVHLALERRGSGSRGISGRPAMIGTVIGVLGVIAAFTIDQAITNTLDNPQRVGVTWGAEIVLPTVSPQLVAQVQRATPGSSVAVARRVLINVGGVGVPTYSVRDSGARAGPIRLATIEGRPPMNIHEADIGPATAQLLHARLGQWLTLAGSHSVRLVGIALFPTDVHSEFDEGLWLTPAGLDAISPPSGGDTAPDKAVVVRFPDRGNQEQTALQVAVTAQATQSLPPGANPLTRLIAELGGSKSTLGSNVTPPSIPLELTNLQNVALLPTILGIGLAALALAALSYVLIVTGRARRRDFAILRAIGLDTRATQYIVFTQAAVIAVVGLVIGVPLGIVTARLAWREIANRVPLVYVPPSAIGVVAVAVPASLILTFLVATWPAHRVARDRASARLQGE